MQESASNVFLQKDKFMRNCNELQYVLKEYERIVSMIRPNTKSLLVPHLEDLEYKLRPGLVTLKDICIMFIKASTRLNSLSSTSMTLWRTESKIISRLSQRQFLSTCHKKPTPSRLTSSFKCKRSGSSTSH